jgi:DDE family transposase
MLLSRIPQQVSNCLAPLSSHFKTRPQGQHFRILCWLLVMLILVQGSATLNNLTRHLPYCLHYWTVLRMIKAGYWDATTLITELAQATLYSVPPPADGVLYVVGDKTISGKTGEKQPLAAYTRMNGYQRFTFGISLVLLIGQWGCFRIPLACAVLNPKKKGDQNIQFRQMLRQFEPPSWADQVIVVADAGFASKDNLRLIIRKQWYFVFAISRTWKLADGTHLRDLANHCPRATIAGWPPTHPTNAAKTIGSSHVALARKLSAMSRFYFPNNGATMGRKRQTDRDQSRQSECDCHPQCLCAKMGCRGYLQGIKKWSASGADASHWKGEPRSPCHAFTGPGLLTPSSTLRERTRSRQSLQFVHSQAPFYGRRFQRTT